MPIQIDQMTLGVVQTNCYIVGERDGGDALIIDPAAQADVILALVEKRGYTVRQILATHAHFDHVLASYAVKQATGAPFRLHRDEVPLLQAMNSSAAKYNIPQDEPPAEPDGFIEVGDVIEVGTMRLETRFTPGHTIGHLTFVMPEHKVAFVGDCIFFNGIGNTSFPGGSLETLRKSILEQILNLPDDFTLCSGHGQITTVGHERAHNPYVVEWLNGG